MLGGQHLRGADVRLTLGHARRMVAQKTVRVCIGNADAGIRGCGAGQRGIRGCAAAAYVVADVYGLCALALGRALQYLVVHKNAN